MNYDLLKEIATDLGGDVEDMAISPGDAELIKQYAELFKQFGITEEGEKDIKGKVDEPGFKYTKKCPKATLEIGSNQDGHGYVNLYNQEGVVVNHLIGGYDGLVSIPSSGLYFLHEFQLHYYDSEAMKFAISNGFHSTPYNETELEKIGLTPNEKLTAPHDMGYLSANLGFALEIATGKIDIESLKNDEAFKPQEDEVTDQISV